MPQSLDKYRDFDEDLDLPDEGPTFNLGGETFHCVPLPAGATLTRLASAIGRDDRGRQVYNLPDMNMFIEDCLIDERSVEVDAEEEGAMPTLVVEPADDIERWRALMNDKKRPIRVKRIAEIVIWLSQVYNEDRPTQRSKL